MKKILFILSLIITTFAQAQTKQYDINKNNSANIGDITTVIDAIKNNKSADANRDGKTDIHDVKAISHYMLHDLDYDYVDLGLPSGTLWATCNVGAEKPEEYGCYYAWGEVETKFTYSWSTYKHSPDGGKTFTKYNINSNYGDIDGKTTLESIDDAAAYNWGNDWQMPTSQDISELRNGDHCTWKKSTINGVVGYVVTSNSNGNSIFLPLGGYYNGTEKVQEGTMGCFWSSSLNTSGVWTAHNMVIDNSNFSFCNLRYYGRNVRPVRKQP